MLSLSSSQYNCYTNNTAKLSFPDKATLLSRLKLHKETKAMPTDLLKKIANIFAKTTVTLPICLKQHNLNIGILREIEIRVALKESAVDQQEVKTSNTEASTQPYQSIYIEEAPFHRGYSEQTSTIAPSVASSKSSRLDPEKISKDGHTATLSNWDWFPECSFDLNILVDPEELPF